MLPNNEYQTPAASPAPASSSASTPSTGLRPSDIILILVSHWPWIVLCVLLGWGVADAIVRFSRPVYTRTASIMIKMMYKGSSSQVDEAALGELGLMPQSVDLNNEMFMLRSPAMMRKVIEQLDLQTDYEVEGTFHRGTLFGNSQPIKVSFLEFAESRDCGFRVTLEGDSTLVLSNYTLDGHSVDIPEYTVELGKAYVIPELGRVLIEPTESWYAFDKSIMVSRHRFEAINSRYSNELDITAEGGSSIINISIEDHNIQRAETILNTMIKIYSEMWIDDRNKMSISTNNFINDRLHVIEEELGNVEGNISSYKSRNLIAGDAESMAGTYLGMAQSAQTQITEYNNQLYMARSVRGYLTNESNYTQLLPNSQGLGNAGISGQISEYNKMLLRRNNLVSASSLSNPIVKDLDNQLAALRSTLISTIDTYINEVQMLIRTAQDVRSQSNSRVAAAPDQNKYLLSVERQQKVKESLYLYLLQKREENELSQAFTAYNSRLVTPPSGSNEPTSPVKKNIYSICLLVGLALPIAVLILLELANTSVRGRKDLDVLNIPFLGEIPLDNPGTRLSRKILSLRRNLRNRNRRHRREDKSLHVLVKPNGSDAMNEAFRVVRTNMEFIAGRGEGARVIMLTSFNPNSGKTFVISNLSITFTFKKKRCLIIDLDMRKRSISAMTSKYSAGLSNYLGGFVEDYHELIRPVPNVEGLDILTAGKLPPNPTELLFEQRLDDLINSVRQEYDYVFLDCPPLEIVADASIVSRLADMTIFVIRAEALNLTALPDVQKYYDEKRLPKMTVLLNGTTDAFSRYGYHRYGSRYGYSYGYGRNYSYGYGYAYGHDAEDEKKAKS